MKRAKLIDVLEHLLTDEYDANELVYCSKKELIIKIIEVAEYYKDELNN